MSKGPWKKGPISPKITLFLRITRAAQETTCSHCPEPIQVGEFYIRLSAVYGGQRYWKFHLTGSCFADWALTNLEKQAKIIEEKRGKNPLDEDPYYPKGKVHLEKRDNDK